MAPNWRVFRFVRESGLPAYKYFKRANNVSHTHCMTNPLKKRLSIVRLFSNNSVKVTAKLEKKWGHGRYI